MNLNTELILLSLLIVGSNTQYIELIDKLVSISWTNEGDYTYFNVKATLTSDVNPSNAWLGIGLNDMARMVSINIFFMKEI
jgi:hypothetical protein